MPLVSKQWGENGTSDLLKILGGLFLKLLNILKVQNINLGTRKLVKINTTM
jgi:hypothetical protein